MEHRCAHRKLVNVEVELHTPDGVVRTGCVRNVSATGAGVTMTRGVPPDGNIVELRFPRLAQTSRTESSPVRGFIVRVRGKEIGLLWLEDCDWQRIGRVRGPQFHS